MSGSVARGQMSVNRKKAVLHVSLFLYSLLWWFNQPVYPYLSKSLGASAIQLGYLTSAGSLMQLLGSPLMGRIMDSHGARLTLLITHSGAALSYLCLSMSNSVHLLYMSQLPTLFLSGMHSSQTYMTVLTDSQERAGALGELSLSYGIGMVLGPILGGVAAEYVTYQQMALIAAVASVLVAVFVLISLPPVQAQTKTEIATGTGTGTTTTTTGAASSTVDTWSAMRKLLFNPILCQLMLIKLLAAFAVSLYRFAFTLLAMEQYSLTPQQNGYVMSAVGILSMLCNSVLVKWLLARYDSREIIRWSLAGATVSLLSVSMSLTLPLLCLTLVPITVCASLASVLLTAAFTTATELQSAGSSLGLDMSIGTASRMIAPLVAALLIASQTLLASSCAITCGAAFVVALSGRAFNTIDTHAQKASKPTSAALNNTKERVQ